MEDLTRYLDEIVEPTLLEFQKNPMSVRHAFLACVTVFHSIDYLAFPRRSQSLRQQFRKESTDFALVDQIAHAFKHVTSQNLQRRLRANEVISRPAAYYGTAVWDLSRWDDVDGGVTLTTDRDIDVLVAVTNATRFLRSKTKH